MSGFDVGGDAARRVKSIYAAGIRELAAYSGGEDVVVAYVDVAVNHNRSLIRTYTAEAFSGVVLYRTAAHGEDRIALEQDAGCVAAALVVLYHAAVHMEYGAAAVDGDTAAVGGEVAFYRTAVHIEITAVHIDAAAFSAGVVGTGDNAAALKIIEVERFAGAYRYRRVVAVACIYSFAV